MRIPTATHAPHARSAYSAARPGIGASFRARVSGVPPASSVSVFSAWLLRSRSRFVPSVPPPACRWRVPVSRVSRARGRARRRRRGSRAFRNGAFPVKHVFSTPNAAHRFPARGPEGRSGKPVRWGLEPQRRGLVVVVGSGRTPVRRSAYRCPPPGSRFRPWSARRPPNFMPGPVRFPSADLIRRARTQQGVSATRRATRIIGTRVPARDTGGSPPYGRATFLLLLITGGVQPRLCRATRHRRLAREAKRRAIPPHSVKHHTETPGQRYGRALLAAQHRQAQRPRLSASSAARGSASPWPPGRAPCADRRRRPW